MKLNLTYTFVYECIYIRRQLASIDSEHRLCDRFRGIGSTPSREGHQDLDPPPHAMWDADCYPCIPARMLSLSTRQAPCSWNRKWRTQSFCSCLAQALTNIIRREAEVWQL